MAPLRGLRQARRVRRDPQERRSYPDRGRAAEPEIYQHQDELRTDHLGDPGELDSEARSGRESRHRRAGRRRGSGRIGRFPFSQQRLGSTPGLHNVEIFAMNHRKAQEFLTRCFAPEETIALLLRRENPVKVMQRVVRLESAIAPRYIGWLAHENITGANVYVAANPLRPGTRKRTKESIASARHLYLDFDTDGESQLSS